jgi:cyanophycin synthetase
MLIRHVFAMEGPNFWSLAPVLSACVDAQDLSAASSATLAGLSARLAQWLPRLCDPQAPQRRPGDFCARLGQGVGLPEVVARACLELQSLAAAGSFEFAAVQATAAPEVHQIAFQYEEERVARACLTEAVALVTAAAHDRDYDAEAAIARLRELANLICLGPSTREIVNAARVRNIPIRRLDDGSLVQLGHGRGQHRIRMAVSDATRAIGQDIAQDKEVTKSLLRMLAIPVPEGRSVESAAEAWQAATEIGLPVVIKPRNANHGRGVAINLTTREQVEKAFDAALPEGDGVLVESFVMGAEYRLLVVGGRMIAASRGEPELVVGDGVRSIRDLVNELNADPRRGEDWASPLCIVEIDPPAELMLANQGYTPASVPPAGASVLIHYNGEFLTDVTDEVHPETAAVAVLAARVVGLDIAGIDLITCDIQQPLHAQGGKIIEVNAGPGLRMHFEPQFGRPRPVGELIVASMFAPDQDGRIPHLAVAGAAGQAPVTRMLRHLLLGRWPQLGIADSQGIGVGNAALKVGPNCGAAAVREGLGFDQSDAVVVLNLAVPAGTADAAAQPAIAPGRFERTILQTLQRDRGTAVLNARDPQVAVLASDVAGKVIYFADRTDDPTIMQHRRRGGSAVISDGRHIILAEGAQQTRLLALDSDFADPSGRASATLCGLLAATAAAWAVGLPPAELGVRLRSCLSEHISG